jgi:hypothetical protein
MQGAGRRSGGRYFVLCILGLSDGQISIGGVVWPLCANGKTFAPRFLVLSSFSPRSGLRDCDRAPGIGGGKAKERGLLFLRGWLALVVVGWPVVRVQLDAAGRCLR